jgi:multisubunit Na+/H+ antiporter MnhE subunit
MYEFNTNTLNRVVSLIISFIIFIVSFSFLGHATCQWIKSYNPEQFSKQVYFKEFFNGIKLQWLSRTYIVVFLLKRTILCSIVTFFLFLSKSIQVYLFVGTQVISTIFVFTVRPFESIKNNVIEIINEIIYLILTIFLIFLKNESRWNGVITFVYIALLMSMF